MTDTLQSGLHTLALHHSAFASLAIFCAGSLLFVLAAAFVALALWRRGRLTRSFLARALIAGVVSGGLTLLLGRLVNDPRPFLAEHYLPLAHASSDNGFPSDHTLVAALLCGWAWALDRRWAGVFMLGLLLVMMGRLAIGAHHTLDVLGSLLIAGAGLLAAARSRLPAGWTRG